ncbi:MAG: hypothetical protein M1840_005219 [Geoglossum simile]|nr:MAG: hypothetical protein M1840_005219 [Geoglossum simile]
MEEVDMTEETKEEMEARLRAELTAQVTTQVATEIARLEEERAAEVLRLETQCLKKKQKKVYNMLEKCSLQERDGRGTTPATSEIGSDMEACLEYTDKGSLVDYPVMMSLKVYFNGKLESSQTVASSMLRYSIFDLNQVELYASKAITQFLGEFDEYTVKWTAVIRISNPRALLVHSDLDTFDSEGTAIVLDACDHQMRSYPSSLSASFMFEVRVTYLASTLKTFKVAQQPPKEQSPISTPVPKDRAGKLEVQQNVRVEALSRAGDVEAKISRKWQCFDLTCTNENGFCWIDNEDPTCKHYSFLAPAQQAWAAQCSSSLCDENRPPAVMIRIWKMKQGTVGRDSRMPIRKEKKTAQETMMEMMEMQAQMQAQQMQLDMAQRMADMSEKSVRTQEQRELRREQQEQQQALPSSYLPPLQPPSYLPQQISSTRPTSSYRPVPHQQSPPPKSSSPIAQDKDEMDTILRFFDKRIHAMVNIERRAKLEAARNVIFIPGQYPTFRLWQIQRGRCTTAR